MNRFAELYHKVRYACKICPYRVVPNSSNVHKHVVRAGSSRCLINFIRAWCAAAAVLLFFSRTYCSRPPALIIQDVETVDPVLNPLLNRELQRTGGRTLIRLGSEDIDFSPDFLLLLVTRNPGARFAPDLCSRVTIVNFTVTPASLQSQVRFRVVNQRYGVGLG